MIEAAISPDFRGSIGRFGETGPFCREFAGQRHYGLRDLSAHARLGQRGTGMEPLALPCTIARLVSRRGGLLVFTLSE